MFDPATTVQILSDQLACMLNIPNSNDVYKSNIQDVGQHKHLQHQFVWHINFEFARVNVTVISTKSKLQLIMPYTEMQS